MRTHVFFSFFLPIEQLSCPKLPFTRLVYVNMHPENSRISLFFFFFSFFLCRSYLVTGVSMAQGTIGDMFTAGTCRIGAVLS